VTRKALLGAAALVLVLGGASAAEVITGCYPITPDDGAGPNAPRFEDYAAKPAAPRKPAPVDLSSHKEARRFRTMLREGAAAGPDFAGHYTIVGWGCGTSCLDFAIVDAANGRVFFPRELRTVSVDHVGIGKDEKEADLDALRYRLDSTLLIVLGAPNEDLARDGIAYYRWTGTSLKLVRFLRSAKRPCGEE
jgi:hypothetical protein